MHYNHRMQWIMAYMTRYWIITLHKTYSRDYNGLSFPHQFPDEVCGCGCAHEMTSSYKRPLLGWLSYAFAR